MDSVAGGFALVGSLGVLTRRDGFLILAGNRFFPLFGEAGGIVSS
jgi:hypothetical protein